MARLPEIVRKGAISQVAPVSQNPAGFAWEAISQIAKAGESFVRPAAIKEAKEEGLNAVYRDENGQLQVGERSVFGGELSDVHNSAAFAKYLAQRSIDMGKTFTELSVKFQFDPAGFKDAADSYIGSLKSQDGVPQLLREEIVMGAEKEASARFNGLFMQQVSRDQSEANRQTKTQRDMLADDYINLMMGGDVKAAEAKYAELERLSNFRKEAPYINETDAETEAFLRGTRGAAKAAVMTQRLEGLVGATEISDETRAEIEAVLKDPDIDPSVRQKLYIATQGRLKGIDAAGIVAGMSDSSFEAMVVRAESSGKAAAKNPNSSALGPHQFLKGTWAGLVSKYNPEWAKGLSSSEISALRADPAKSSEMYQHFRRENQQVLQAAGLPINPATEYLAHFLGAGDAVKLIGQDPNALASSVLSDKVIKANPFLEGKTVRDVQNWAARKMTMKASDLALMTPQIEQITDAEVRAMAMSALNQQITARNKYEAASSAEYDLRMANSDDTLTEQEIVEDHNLSDDMQRQLVNALRTQRKEQVTVQQTVSDLNNPDVGFDVFDSKDRNRVDKAYSASLDGEKPLSAPDHIGSALQITARAGFAPATFNNAIRAGLQSKDPAEVAIALEAANQAVEASPTAFAAYGGRSEIEKALSDYKTMAEFRSPEEAAQAMIDAREEVPKNVTDEAKKLAKDLKIADVINEFDESWFSDPTIGVEGDHEVRDLMPDYLEGVIMGEYKDEFTKAYGETGDFDRAKTRALDYLGRTYGPNTVTGSKRIMKFPPQHFYPPVNGSQDWMKDQLETEISQFVFGDDAAPLTAGDFPGDVKGNWIDAKRIHLLSDEQTRADVNSGKSPSYQLYFYQDGNLELHPQRFFFDPAEAKAAARADFEAGRAVASFNLSARDNYYRNVEMFGADRAKEMIREEEQGNAVPR
ncbi:MAG: hypothetical protein EP341_00260 [Sphingomonadales bacterium]|nr:MAG: hypothetical protein EP341_00260 [Sphingomonadales bacterium]